jgi:hypothetical protein
MVNMQEITFQEIVVVALLFSIPFYFSIKAKTLFFHLLYVVLAISMFRYSSDEISVDNIKLIIGLGLLIPQIKFIVIFIKDTIATIKMMSVNTYYFFITIYYKIIRFINWIKSSFIMLKVFFTSFNSNNDDYFKEENNQSSYEEKYYQEQEYYKQDKDENSVKDEYKKFYSSNDYEVLGVSPNDDYKTIKKSYKKLVRIYHPDLNPNDIKLYTEITQNINSAWENIDKKIS